LYLTNTGEVAPWSRDSDGVVWRRGEKKSILRFLPRLLLGEMPCWDGISPKRGKHSRGHLVHAIGGKCRESLHSLSIEGKVEMRERGETKQGILFRNRE